MPTIRPTKDTTLQELRTTLAGRLVTVRYADRLQGSIRIRGQVLDVRTFIEDLNERTTTPITALPHDVARRLLVEVEALDHWGGYSAILVATNYIFDVI